MMMGSPITRGGIAASLPAVLEVQRLREELRANRAKLASWEEGIAQARTACDAWRREAEEANQKARQAQQEKNEVGLWPSLLPFLLAYVAFVIKCIMNFFVSLSRIGLLNPPLLISWRNVQFHQLFN